MFQLIPLPRPKKDRTTVTVAGPDLNRMLGNHDTTGGPTYPARDRLGAVHRTAILVCDSEPN